MVGAADVIGPRVPSAGFDVVTGAFGYSGAAIAVRLLGAGRPVRTLTNHPERAPSGSPVEAAPLDFRSATGLVASLRGADTLYNTYWIRFARGPVNHELAVANSVALFRAAADAGVRRIVHVSITHPDPGSPLPYFSGKARVEAALAECGVSHAIVRPSVLFGGDGVLINNIAWLLRRAPVFAVGDGGGYRLRGIHVDDLAQLCTKLAGTTGNQTVDAVGPDRPTFAHLVRHIKAAVGSRALIVNVPGAALLTLSGALGFALRDTLLTRDEYRAMAAGLADTDGEATGTTSMAAWIEQNADTLGRTYAHEVRRHFR
jgi:NADH dehydrogenase